LICKNCRAEIPLRDEDFNEPESGKEYFVKVSNPSDEKWTTKKEDYFCSLSCLIEHEDSE
jgi:hypothetical protein